MLQHNEEFPNSSVEFILLLQNVEYVKFSWERMFFDLCVLSSLLGKEGNLIHEIAANR